MKKMFAIVLALMLCVSVLSVAAFAAEDTITIHVSIDASSAPNAWAWGDYGDAFSTWPGEAMTKNGDWYEITVPAGTTGFIANNGSAQTSDIAIAGDADAWIKISADFSSYEVVAGPNSDEPVAPPVVEGDFYVAGNSVELFGAEWDAGNAANKMTLGDDGCYYITYTAVPAGKYSLKVTNGTWDQSWGGNGENGNFDFELTEPTDVTVKFNPNKQDVTVIAGEAVLGDMSLAAVSVALLAATAGLVAVVSKKKEF